MGKKFIAAFKAGSGKVDIYKKNINEIKHVLSDLDSQIFEATQKKVNIALFETSVQKFARSIEVLSDELSQNLPRRKQNRHVFLIAKNSTSKKMVKIAKWHQSETGFPCKVESHESNFICNNREELEEAIVSTLSEAETAEDILNVASAEQ